MQEKCLTGKRPAGTGGVGKMGNKKRILLDIFCKTLDSDTLKIYISAQVSRQHSRKTD